MTPSLAKVTHPPAKICQFAKLPPDARALLGENMAAPAYLDALLEAKKFTEAVRFLAHGLPPRDAVAWTCVCAREFADPEAHPDVPAALDAAAAWVRDPSDANRRAAKDAADKAGLESPEACAAMAAFLSGGSIAPPHVNEVPPPPQVAQQIAAGGLILCAVADPAKAEERYSRIIHLGIRAANRPG